MIKSSCFILVTLLVCNARASVPVFPPFMGTPTGYTPFPTPNSAPFTYCGPSGYQPGQVVISAEDWWRREIVPASGAIGGIDFGHLHNEVCVYHAQQLPAGNMTIGSLLHQNTGNISSVTFEDRVTEVNTIGTASFIKPRRARNATASNGIVIDSTIVPGNDSLWTVRWNDSVNTNYAFPYSGVYRVRTRVNTDLPERTFENTKRTQRATFSFNILVDDSNGKPANKSALPLDPYNNTINAVGWSTLTNYTSVTMWMPPKYPIGGLWRPRLSVQPGSKDSQPITRSIITWNPNFHKDQPGKVFMNITGNFSSQINMDVHAILGASTNGWNKVIIQGKTVSPDGATNTGSLACNLQISNGADCTRGALQTHAYTDNYMSLKKTISTRGVVSYSMSTYNSSYENHLTPLNVTATGNVTYQRIVQTTYNLTFLQASNGIASASVWMHIRSNTGAVGRTVNLFDANNFNATSKLPCVNPATCNPVGSGVLGAAGEWTELKFSNTTFLNGANTAKKLHFWVALNDADNGLASVKLSSASYYGTPVLIVTPSCAA